MIQLDFFFDINRSDIIHLVVIPNKKIIDNLSIKPPNSFKELSKFTAQRKVKPQYVTLMSLLGSSASVLSDGGTVFRS